MRTTAAGPPRLRLRVDSRRRAAFARAPANAWQVAGIILMIYGAIVALQVHSLGMRSLVNAGTLFVDKQQTAAHRSAAIARVQTAGAIGYDGQFVYFIDLDPVRARYYIDDPGYRFGRIGYPAAAWLLALGQPGAFPYTLIGINLFAVSATVWLLAGFLRRRGLSAWWAAVYGFYPGMVVCVTRDLTEPLGFFLATLAVVLLERRPERALRYAPLLALAALTRETTAVIALVLTLQVALHGRVGLHVRGRSLLRATLFAAIWIAPVAAYRTWLRYWLGYWPTQKAFETGPFRGLASYRPFDTEHMLVIVSVVLPGLIWLLIAAGAALRRGLSLGLSLVIASVLVFVVFLPSPVYINYASSIRASIAIVLAAILALPSLRSLPRPAGLAVKSGMLLLTPIWLVLSLAVAGSLPR